jgi:N-sulfoglucosamine sulfohydrolase
MSSPTAPAPAPLNVLYLHSHDTGRYVQPYGHAIPAPRLQRLAEEGVLFRQHFCVNPTCSPARAALLTGQYAHSCGQLGLAHRGFELQHPERHLAWTLRRAGYATTLAGVQHVVRDPAVTGYETIMPGRRAEDVVPNAVGFLRRVAETRPAVGGRPFFLDAGFQETHRDFRAADPARFPAEDARYCLPPAPLPDTPETRRDVADFKASVRVWDAAVGEILEALEATGLADSTLVVCTTDHGIAFPAMKCNLTDHGTGVLLILRGPGGLSGGKVVDAMVTHLDVFPTVCDLAGIDPPGWLQGSSLLPLVRGEAERLHDAVFAELNYHVPYEPQRAVRTERWKYVRRFDDFGHPMLSDCDDGPSKDVWLRHGWGEQDTDREALFDLVFDPQERHNLLRQGQSSDAGSAPAVPAALAAVLDEMRRRLDRWMAETDDPLLQGPVPAPPGATVGPPGALSPKGS